MKEKKNEILERSFQFALRSISFYQALAKKGAALVLAQQLLRSSTSVGANVEEAQGAQSRSDFIHKISIAHKECRETIYWLKLFDRANLSEQEVTRVLLVEAQELSKILASILLSTKSSGVKNFYAKNS